MMRTFIGFSIKIPRKLNPALIKMDVSFPAVYTFSTPMLNIPNMEVNNSNDIEYNYNNSSLHPKVTLTE